MLFSSIASRVAAVFAWPWPALHAGPDEPLQPTIEMAHARAHHIFRAINNAGRQWGSAMNHNGFSFFPAIVPAGTVLYHGSPSEERPATFEWLAFEHEHAEAFAIDVELVAQDDDGKGGNFHASMKDDSGDQKRLGQSKQKKASANGRWTPGYIQTYQATKDLKALYLDGMSGGKTTLGTMDLELYVLYGKKNEDYEDDEWARAEVICKDITQWGYDGYIRMEVGFEYIHCDFSKDLDLISSLRVHDHQGVISDSSMITFQWARAVAENYDGVGADRLRIDFSSMLSGLLYPLNITTTDPARRDLMRLATAGIPELQRLKVELERISRQPRRFTVNWQAVTESIVRRYANRLAFMASGNITQAYLIDEFETASRSHVAVPEPRSSKAPLSQELLKEAIERCVSEPLLPATLKKSQWSREDGLIAAALRVVTQDICTVILQSYNALRAAKFAEISGKGAASSQHLEKAANRAQQDVRELVATLGWSQWRQLRPCPHHELMFTIMWPFGNREDYFNPGCVPINEIDFSRGSYFRGNFPGGHMPGRRPKPDHEKD
ncbi:hypothetical protein NLG97_g4798 [Lecanicillium saksenae]|uniref:Uncharacterized protein n=1 Tax=Lecanicillium saksenae TaxID=468837 RepID=A0ACC1QW48_9HYPO|nr:hypothetical protein NLG97_g4798 [Lecanicillium saksenae]